ncbi:MAG TPA: hypothetical protein VHK65_06235 [Candidatus Dormibacteraeota bacterium]|nr:hypothetical protein [Candidatus Dormibacteraeota bacterium]
MKTEKAQQADPMLELRYALPSRAHGDAREKLLYMLLQDAADTKPVELDGHFRDRLPELVAVPDALARQVIAEAMQDAYWTRPKRVPYLVPYHSSFPLSFRLSRSVGGDYAEARYKLFSGAIIPFLCWRDGAVDKHLVGRLLDFMNDTRGFSLADRLMHRAVLSDQPERPTAADADVLVGRLGSEIAKELEERPFCPFALVQFQEDLNVLLDRTARLPRRDVVDMLTELFSLHLATYYYRLAQVLGEQLDEAVAASADIEAPSPSCPCTSGLESCTLAGRIRFRVGSGGDRPVSRQDGCATAYRDVDARRLHPLPATIATANISQHIWAQLGGPSGPPSRPRLADLASELRRNDQFRAEFNVVAAGIAAINSSLYDTAADPAAIAEEVARQPNLFGLYSSILASKRPHKEDGRRVDRLKYHGRDVVNQLVKIAPTATLIRTRGSVIFYELDERMLFLSVLLICGVREVPFDTFVTKLRRYGLSPQDASERTRLADALERLGMLHRYSDAGESTYVHYPL